MSARGLDSAARGPHSASAIGPGDLLLSLLRRCRLSRREQAIVITVLLAPSPLTSLEIARQTRLAYAHAKAVIRALVDWRILKRTPEGLAFQPDPARWGPPTVPSQLDESDVLAEGNTTDASPRAEPRLDSRLTSSVASE